MKILIAADMEGVTGVVCWDHVDAQHPEYQRFRKLMTGDVNAAIRGAFEGGAEDVMVSDGHAWGRNILIEDLDTRAQLNSGSPSPLSMVRGRQRDRCGDVRRVPRTGGVGARILTTPGRARPCTA